MAFRTIRWDKDDCTWVTRDSEMNVLSKSIRVEATGYLSMYQPFDDIGALICIHEGPEWDKDGAGESRDVKETPYCAYGWTNLENWHERELLRVYLSPLGKIMRPITRKEVIENSNFDSGL